MIWPSLTAKMEQFFASREKEFDGTQNQDQDGPNLNQSWPKFKHSK